MPKNNNNNNNNNNKNKNNKNKLSPANELLNKLLLIRDQLKLYHWQTESYARHKASDKFVTKATDITDKIIEVYQGKYGRIRLDGNTNTIKLGNLNDKDIVAFLETLREFFIKDFPDYVNKNANTDLLNIRDELLAEINNALYLFTLA